MNLKFDSLANTHRWRLDHGQSLQTGRQAGTPARNRAPAAPAMHNQATLLQHLLNTNHHQLNAPSSSIDSSPPACRLVQLCDQF